AYRQRQSPHPPPLSLSLSLSQCFLSSLDPPTHHCGQGAIGPSQGVPSQDITWPMGAQVDTAHADQENETEEPSCDSPSPPPLAHSLEEEDEEHPIEHGRRQGVATGKTMGGMKERLGRQDVRGPRAVNRLFHPALQQGDAESIEDKK